jgi:hypothetical protein
MVSLRQLNWIHKRLCEIFPQARDRPFAGVSIIIAGDYYQLPPVGESGLYSTGKTSNPDTLVGQQLYRLFDRTITLDVIKRQQGDDAESRGFRQALDNLRVNKVTMGNWQLLSTRVQAKLTYEEIRSFDDAIRIYAHKQAGKGFNAFRLRQLQRPVLLILATHTGGSLAEKASTEESGNLHIEMPVSINARIMLRENLWVDRRLFNGSMGTIRDIVWEEGANYETDPPLALLTDFDDYKQDGPYLVKDPKSGRSLVPIFRVKREWQRGSVRCTRTQFPITIAYAITIHKSQGISVDRAVLNSGKKKDFAPGLTYVAISRVRSLRGIMFEEPFDFKRLKFRTTEVTIMRATDAAKRARQEIALPVSYPIDDDLLDLSTGMTFPAIGQASQMDLPILPSEPIAPSDQLKSTITITSGLPLSSEVDTQPQQPAPVQPPLVLPLVAGLRTQNPDQYLGTDFMASQGSTQNRWFQCLHPTLCNYDTVPAAYRAVYGVNVCIWCNNGISLDNPQRVLWCYGLAIEGGHPALRSEVEDGYCQACSNAIA